MALDKITTDIIADDAVTAAKIPAGAIGTSEIAYFGDGTGNLSGTITNQQLHFGTAFTLTDNLTVNGDLILGKVRDDGTGQSITGSGRTLSGTGTLTMGSSISDAEARRITTVDGMTGELGSGVTGGSGLTELGTVTASGGNTIDTSVPGYKIHKFTSSGTFTVTSVGIVDVLVVAGGGGGGNSLSGNGGGGGGGAGGYLYSSTAVNARAYTITVGGGGAVSAANTGTWGTNGGNSSAFGLVAIGGGGGMRGSNATIADDQIGRGNDGGSGGGGGYRGYNIKEFSGGLGLQGFNGGAITVGSGRPEGAGGGGSSAVGQNNTTSTPDGGAGTANTITGASVTYAAGGAGGDNVGSAGAANTGNGGGGSYGVGASGAGGSGIVIIRYVV